MAPGSVLAGVFALSAVPPALLLVLVWRQRDEPGARFYAAMLGVMVVYNLLYALTLVVHAPGHHEFLTGLAVKVKLAVTIPWVLFALEYTGRGRFVSRPLVAGLSAVPVVGTVVMFTPASERLLMSDYALDTRATLSIGTFESGPLRLVMALFGFALLAAGLAMLLEFVVSDRQRYGYQTGILAIAGLLPGITTAIHVGALGPVPGLDLTALGYAAVAPLVGYGLIRYDLFGFVPAVGRIGKATALDDFGDAVVIVDAAGQVADLNDRAASLFQCSPDEVIQTPVNEVLEASLDLEAGDQAVTVETRRGNREYDVTVSPVEGANHRRIGYTIVFHDVTHEKQRRQRLEVLNRVLRHNLRNGVNAIAGFSSRLEAHTPEDMDWMHDRIEGQSAHLMEISERASAIDRVTDPAPETSRFAIRAALGAVRERLCEESPSPRVSVDSSDELTLTSNREIVEETLYFAGLALIANGDPDAAADHLAVEAREFDGRDGWLRVLVTSNGDPIPADEQAVIERGEETPLNHGRALDLWLVAWGAETLGGELEFVDGDAGPGIAIALPDLQPDPDGPAGTPAT